MKRLPLIIAFLLISNLSYGATCTRYVSPSGNATWANSTNISTPTSVATAFSNAAADDVVCFRGGTYTVPQNNRGDSQNTLPYYYPVNSGTSGHPITFQAYPGETPLFNGTSGGTGDNGTWAGYFQTIMGIYHTAYATFDGFKFECDSGVHFPRFRIGYDNESAPPYSTNHIIVQNCDFNGGSTTLPALDDNAELIGVYQAGYVTIQNNKFYSLRTVDGWHNTSAFKSYNTDHITIQNNEIYNVTNALYLKRDAQYYTISYNFLHDNDISIYVAAYNTWSVPGLNIYQNVFANSLIGITDDISDGQTIPDNYIYNNSFYTSSNPPTEAYIQTSGSNAHIYNNAMISPHAPSDYSGAVVRHTTSISTLIEHDYNSYGNTNFQVRGPSGTYYSTLASWAASTELSGGGHPDTHGVASATSCFTNGSGNLNTLNDFLIKAPCVGAGKAGADIGANVALVGPSGGSSPATPTNMSGGAASGGGVMK